MICKKLKELYCVDTISQDKGWKKVREALVGLTDNDKVEIDFTGINVVDPWQCPEFKKLLRDDNVIMKFTNCDEMVKRIRIMCIVDGLHDENIINVEIELPKVKTAEEIKIEKNGQALISEFEVNGDTAVFKVANKYTQMHSTTTINYIDYAIKKLVEDKGIKHVIIDANGVSILKNVIEAFANLIVNMGNEGVQIEIDISDPENINNLKLFIHQAMNETLSIKQRTKILISSIQPNTAGMLLKYKKSKALDEFGRHGNGEVVSSRIAIFRELKADENGQDVAVIDSYNNGYFYTKQHWMVEHDNEELDKLKVDTFEIPMDELGLGDKFLGSKFHFMAPIQQSESESRVVIVGIDDNDRNIKKKCTIPERMQIVFDDWGVEYDKEALNIAIDETRKLLNITE